MSPGDIIGTIGVTILLIAFALNIANKLNANSAPYLLMNAVGAALTGYSSYLISFWPFVVLESVWTLSSLIMFLRTFKKSS